MRADARRNRAAILEVARSEFAHRGREAQVDEIARSAGVGVGVGTLYRHFPDKQVLLAALARERFAQLAEFAQDALLVDDDPWAALVGFCEASCALQAQDLALSQLLQDQPELMSQAACERGDLLEALETLMARAQAAGVVRPDARALDLPMICCAMTRASGPPGASWPRMLALALDGLRARGAALPE